jgi:murein DD-endopeptidase MepM/ murein hydrolase activator NlpD
MLRNSVPALPVTRIFSGVVRAGISGLALTVAACSADITRFDSPYFGLNDTSGTTGSLPAASGSAALSDQTPLSGGGGYAPPPRADVRVISRPEVATPTPAQSVAPSARTTYSAPPSSPVIDPPPQRSAIAARDVAQASPPAPATGSVYGQKVVDVQRGDTLFSIARRHNVRVDEIRRQNNLTSSMIRPGQQLVLPGGAGAVAKPVGRPVASAEPKPRIPASAGDGTYTLQPGDSLYSVARSQKISVAELQRINGITDPRRLQAGTVLKLKAGAPASAPESVASSVAPPVATPSYPETMAPVATTTRPTIINGRPPASAPQTQVAAVDQRATLTDAAPLGAESGRAQGQAGTEVAGAASAVAGAASSPDFRWPATGRVLAKFGPRGDGTHNDGIDIAVPLGAEVVAAESGVVAYAGNELKGFGNLVLVRHEGGWVTAYAHNDELLVARGARVRRGQPIAKAGKSGNVDQPMLHFEVRQGSKPIDPLPVLQK